MGTTFQKAAFAGLVGILCIWTQPVFASRLASADMETEVREGPSMHSRVVAKLKKHQEVLASNVPIEGFHKIKTESGEVGWVPADVLLLQEIPLDDKRIEEKENRQPEELEKKKKPRLRQEPK